jgi:spore maturation protein CgeB
MRNEFRCDLSYLGTHASDRQAKLMRLLNQPAALLSEHRFLVAGAMYPENTKWQTNVTRLTHVPPSDHPAFYSSARFTLNLTRSDIVVAGYSPSVRLFEASACATPILSDDWQGLEDFLSPGSEILLPQDEYDVTDILLHMSEKERRRIGWNARERILAEHTSTHRAAQFEDIIASLYDLSDLNGTAPRKIEGRDPVSPPTTAVASKLLYTAR